MLRQQWWVLLCAAAVALIAAAFVLLKSPKQTGGSPRVVRGVDAGAACPDEDLVPAIAAVVDNHTPVVLWAAGDVRLFFDGEPAFSSPEAPKTFAPGEHELRAVSGSGTQLKLKVRLDAFTPAVFHLENDAQVGLNLVQAGSTCVSCENALSPVSIAFSPPAKPVARQSVAAAKAARLNDWLAAAEALRHVLPADRKGTAYLRLSATTLWLSGQSSLSEAVLAKLAAEGKGDWPGLWKNHLKLTTSETTRQNQLLSKQWNALTEKFNGLRAAFALDAPGAEGQANSRFIELYRSFSQAQSKRDIPTQEQVLRSAHEVLGTYVKALRATRPGECTFQARVTQRM
jgi:hypothetical protein